MDILLACCAGLDVHKDSVQVCVRELESSQVRQQTRHLRKRQTNAFRMIFGCFAAQAAGVRSTKL
jgi:hypothetical protein